MAQRIHHSVVVGLLVAAACVLAVFDPASARIYPACPFHALTGWLCPLCGTTRALHALLHAQIVTALRCNLVAVAAVLWTVTSLVVRRRVMFNPRAWLFAALLFGVARNLPVMSSLRP